MRIDETDTTELAQRLRLGPHEFLRAVGGPWWIVERAPESEAQHPGTLFVGRAGPSVGVLLDQVDGSSVVVGLASGRWDGPATLVWRIADPSVELPSPAIGASMSDVDAFIEALRSAVDDAAAAKSSALVTCRYCGMLVAPEHAFDDNTCQGCGVTVFGAAY